MALTAVPSVPEITRLYRLHGAAGQVFSELQWARMAAISENTRYRLKLDLAGKVKLHRYDAGQGEWVEVNHVKNGPADSPDLTVTMNDLDDAIIFAPNGAAPTSATVTIMSAEGEVKEVVVSRAGSIRIE